VYPEAQTALAVMSANSLHCSTLLHSLSDHYVMIFSEDSVLSLRFFAFSGW